MLTVKKNQPEAYEEIHTFMDKLEAETAKKKKGETTDPVMREYLEKYEEISQMEKNRDKNNFKGTILLPRCWGQKVFPTN
ncbi:hypothetical protein ACTNA4_15675 [Bariatricus sp. HCP28S3_A7]|uniref:hypothetical protein n=1 Tax=Bariatricus sp. HCP28S3_A7 TaxID=3438894 RepID=UPI003F896DD4